MYTQCLIKPDGRSLTLYGRQPLDIRTPAPSPFPEPLKGAPHLRWHPLRGEWVTYAAYRQDRTFLPPPEYNPFMPGGSATNVSELPAGNWDVAVFDNRFPSLSLTATQAPTLIVPTHPAIGHCDVVVFTQDAQASLGTLSLEHLQLLLEVWADRTNVLGNSPDIAYVMPFQNRGAEVGVTLHHPHGQIYAYSRVPPIPARMQEIAREYYQRHHRGALQDLIHREINDEVRLIYRGEQTVAFVPVCARYPFEVWVAPIEPVATFVQLSSTQRADLARVLQIVLRKFDALWNRPFPYLMSWYQAPVDGQPHPESHLHAEFFPPYRTRDKLKYLAGTEIGAGLFAMDTLPEDSADTLRQVVVNVNE